MPRTIAPTGTELVPVQLQRVRSGQVKTLPEDHLPPGADVIGAIHPDLTPGVAARPHTGLIVAFEALARDVDAVEAL